MLSYILYRSLNAAVVPKALAEAHLKVTAKWTWFCKSICYT